ncbi:hypothetical protein [Actibacterium sp. D379-3]
MAESLIPDYADARLLAPEGSRRSRIDWLLFTTLLLQILNSGGVQYYDIYVLTAATALLQLLMLSRVRWQLSARLRPALLLFFIYLIYVLAIIPTFGDVRYVMIHFNMIGSALLTLNYLILRKPDFGRTFSAVFLFLLLHGFVNWVLVSTAFSFFSSVPDIRSYQLLYIFFGMSDQYFGIHRSQSLFWEPGVYQLYLNIALHYFLFYDRRKWAVPAIVGVLLTLSTTGIVIAGLQIAYFAVFNDLPMRKKVTMLVFVFPVILCYALFASSLTADKVSGSQQGSFLARSFDTRNGLSVALDYPFGIGFNNKTYQNMAAGNVFNVDTDIVITDRGQTNGVVKLLYSTGWFWAAVLLFLTYRQRLLVRHRTLFFLVLIGSLSTQALFFSPFVFLFVVSGSTRFWPDHEPRRRSSSQKRPT